MKAVLAIVLSSITLLSVAAGNQGYVVDSSGEIVKTGTGLCLHTNSWTPADAVEGCDPVPAKPVVKAKPIPVTLSSDVLFAFDSATLTAKGKKALNALVSQIGGTVIIVGHTDRIGSKEYNQPLSEARAASVAEYLNSKVKADYAVSGVGFTQPSGKTAQCTGPVDDKLISCLAPDRRVVITIVK
jgi:OOP family OmpA-OmpF porin